MNVLTTIEDLKRGINLVSLHRLWYNLPQRTDFTNVCVCVVSKRSRNADVSTSRYSLVFSSRASQSLWMRRVQGQGGGGVGGGRGGDSSTVHILKLSPQPHVPLMLGLLKTNSLDSFDSTKSISVPSSVS